MNKTNELYSAIKEVLNSYSPRLFFWHAPINIGYPRGEYELKRLDVDLIEKYLLTINFYDKNTFLKIQELADILDKEISAATFENPNFYFKIVNTNDRQIINESDASIARLMFTYEINVYRRENPYE